MTLKITMPTEQELEKMIRDAGSCQDIEMYEMYAELTYLRLSVTDLRKRLDWSWSCHTNLKQVLSAEKDELQRVITWYNKKLDEAYVQLHSQTGFKHSYQKLNNVSVAPEWYDSKSTDSPTFSPVHDGVPSVSKF